jgi:hypothetical protein
VIEASIPVNQVIRVGVSLSLSELKLPFNEARRPASPEIMTEKIALATA